jgi:hypothetical protein
MFILRFVNKRCDRCNVTYSESLEYLYANSCSDELKTGIFLWQWSPLGNEYLLTTYPFFLSVSSVSFVYLNLEYYTQ